jgi:hypothetical protein
MRDDRFKRRCLSCLGACTPPNHSNTPPKVPFTHSHPSKRRNFSFLRITSYSYRSTDEKDPDNSGGLQSHLYLKRNLTYYYSRSFMAAVVLDGAYGQPILPKKGVSIGKRKYARLAKLRRYHLPKDTAQKRKTAINHCPIKPLPPKAPRAKKPLTYDSRRSSHTPKNNGEVSSRSSTFVHSSYALTSLIPVIKTPRKSLRSSQNPHCPKLSPQKRQITKQRALIELLERGYPFLYRSSRLSYSPDNEFRSAPPLSPSPLPQVTPAKKKRKKAKKLLLFRRPLFTLLSRGRTRPTERRDLCLFKDQRVRLFTSRRSLLPTRLVR